VLWASSRLAPSCSTRPCDLPVQKTRDASNRRLPPKRLACTRISCVPGFRSRLSSRGHPTESKALRGITGGPNGSRRSDRFGGLSLTQHRRCSHSSVCLVRSASRLSGHERGRFLPTARGAIEPLTSLVASSRSPRLARHLRARALIRPSSCWACVRIVVMGNPPSLPSTPARDDRRFQQTRMPSLGKDPS
jgi:hypothetical protein